MIYLLVTVLLLASTVRAEEEGHSPVVKDMFEKRCLKNANLQDAQDLIDFVKLPSNCIPKEDLVALDDASGQERLSFFCSTLRARIDVCAKTLAAKLKPCLAGEEAYLDEFIIATVKQSLNNFCSEESKKLRKDLDTKAVKECAQAQSHIARKCIKQSKLIEAFTAPDSVVKKYDLCSILIATNDCLVKSTNEECKDKGISTYLQSLFTGLTSQCDCHEEVEHQHHHH